MTSPPTIDPGAPVGERNVTAAATLVDELIRRGVREAVVAPGSRSTPLALAVAERGELTTHVVLDERVAAFMALGLAAGDGSAPAILICTSGTAAANFLPAVVEAGLSDIPVIVVTADRPPELRGVGAPQTIDQLDLYGRAVRAFVDAPPPDSADPGIWRTIARDAFRAAVGRTVADPSGAPPGSAGPVHINVPFREPLLGIQVALPAPLPATTDERPFASAPGARRIDDDAVVAAAVAHQRGVIVVGGRSGADGAAVVGLGARLGWPVLADPCSGVRHAPGVITAFDGMLRNQAFADAHAPDVIVRVGRVPASKVVSRWTARSRVVQVGGPGVMNPEHNVVAFTDLATIERVTADFAGADGTPWLARWQHANDRAETAIETVLDGYGSALTEPGVARAVAGTVARIAEAELVASSSMPVRDLEWYGGRDANAFSNRGANGIDGVVATAIGRALTGHPVIVLIGDVAFLHDAGALTALSRRGADVRIVVVDNDGGGIFGFLPQHEALAVDRFEQLFGTPHGTDLLAFAAAHHLAAFDAWSLDELTAALAAPGPSLIRVTTDRDANLAVHASLNTAIIAAVAR